MKSLCERNMKILYAEKEFKCNIYPLPNPKPNPKPNPNPKIVIQEFEENTKLIFKKLKI